MLNSTECKRKIAEFQSIKKELSGIITSLDEYISEFNDISIYLEDLIVSGESFGKDKLSNISTSLGSSKRIFATIINECDGKIALYNEKLKAAIIRETKDV